MAQAKQSGEAFKACLKQAKIGAGSEEIGKTKIIQNGADPQYSQKLNDPTYATPEEAEAALRYAVARRPFLGTHIQNLSRMDNELGLSRSEAAAASDRDLMELAKGSLTWGELNGREQERGKKIRKKVQAINQRIDPRLSQQNQVETQARGQARQTKGVGML